ncbi:MAG: iron-sulfur cluster repair di-iron protein [Bacteroidetes bacterium]|nr:iron-sulfur cluster repair di-iron protein [Bacteroidota bacterium]
METIETIDVTILEPRMKHPTIFKKFDEILAGESFIIFNDHDPKPLYYQLIGERGNIFTWEYLENGPENWLVKIQKNTAEQNEKSIGEMVASDYRKAEVFKKFNIDFCCGGKKTISQACKNKNVDQNALKAELDKLDLTPAKTSTNYNEWSADFMVDYIVNTHHNYVKTSTPILLEFLAKVAKVHGDSNPEAISIYKLFVEIADELTSHMEKEENILFPYIKQLATKNKTNAPFGSVKNPINMMEHEHDSVGRLFEQIRELSNNYTPPKGACTTYKVSYLKLEEYENDLHQHIHLENNILFPKSIALESELN